MSSLLQHHGGRSSDGRKVELLCYLVHKTPKWEEMNGPTSYKPSPDSTVFADDSEPTTLTRPDGTQSIQPRLYRFYRRPVGMWGCWVVFRYNGTEHVPDLSIPIQLFKLPKDAKPLTNEEAQAYWFTNR